MILLERQGESMKKELGNLLFGHPVGEEWWSIPRTAPFEGLLDTLLHALGGDGYGVKFDNKVFQINPYCWCGDEVCPQCGIGEQVNFWFKPTDFKIKWYKYPLRDSYANRPVSELEFLSMINKCILSLGMDDSDGKEDSGGC